MASEIVNIQLNGNDPALVAATTETVGHVVNGSSNGCVLPPEDIQVNGGVAPKPSTSAPPPPEPTYDDVFPALPGGNDFSPSLLGNSFASASIGSNIQSRPKIRSSNVTKVYRVASDERRSRNISRRFGEHGDLSKICADIMAKTETEIQVTSSKDGTLTFLISGKDELTNKAKRMLASEFQAPIVHNLWIPKEHHRIILGKGGKKLSDIEQNTGTKIHMPKQHETSDVIRITGARESIEKAVHEIQLISNEALSRSVDRITVPKIFHQFITGPFGKTVEKIMKETDAKVHIPPQSVINDEITITGERNNVKAAKERVAAIYEEKSRLCQTVSIEVKKHQHKYIIGPRGHTLNEIMEITDVSVEMPPSDSPSETIVLRGESAKLPNALAVLYQKAHSETEEEIEVPGWIQRHILGPKGSTFQEFSQEFPKVNVSFKIEENRIKMSGPVADVQKANELIKQRAKEIADELSVEEIKVADSKHIKFIVGKNGTNLKQIRDETKATIQVISNDSSATSSDTTNSDKGSPVSKSDHYIRIEGTKEAVAKAKEELETMLKKLENEVSYELLIERRFYGQIIGAKGEKIRDIRNKFNQVMIIFPEQNDDSEKVVIRGAKKDAEQCYKHLLQMNKELLLNNYRIEVPIFKQLLQFQGKDSIKKIREDTGTRIDLQSDNGNDIIVISGPKDKVEKAQQRIQVMQSNLSDMIQVDIIIPSKIHNYMLGSKGRNIKQIMSECGDVIINFPDEGSGSDRVNIRGPKDCVHKAKQMLVEMSNDFQTNNYSEELKVRVEHHRYLIGKNGSNINKLREQANVRVYFASDSDGSKKEDSDRVVITGKKDQVQKARAILEAKIKDLDKEAEAEMHIDPKYHYLFVARRAAVCKQLYEEYGGVHVSFPHQSDKQNDRITLKGPKECLDAVKQRILEIIADHDAKITIDVEIDPSHHRHLCTSRVMNANTIQQEHDVKIKFPTRPKNTDQTNGFTEGSQEAQVSNIVTITGRKENCEKAKEVLLSLIPVTSEVSIPYEFHRFIIGQKGVEIKELMDKCQVQIRVPPPTEKSDIITVIGTSDNVNNARKALEEKLVKLEEEKADREARSFQVTLQVDPIYHPKIIGKRGSVISSIRSKYEVQIQVPESRSNSGQDAKDTITITGYEKNANEAKEHILKIVKELEELVTEEVNIDARIHSRLIGTRGKNIRKIMDEYKVDIRFPRGQNGENPDTVTINGAPENVEKTKEHLLDLAEGFLDDIETQYQAPLDHQLQISFDDLCANGAVKESPKCFVVRGGPWEKKKHSKEIPTANGGSVDTSNAQDFPAFGLATGAVATDSAANTNGSLNGTQAYVWGPKRN